MAQVVCAGVIVADVLVQGADEGVFRRDITRLPVRLMPGGDACNQAADLAALGVETELLGKVGADGVGDVILAELRRRGVKAERIVRTEKAPTSVSVVLIRPDGERSFIGTKDGTNSMLQGEDFDLEALSGAKIFSLGSLYGSRALTGELAGALLRAAKEAGCFTVSDMMHGDRFPLEDAEKALIYVDLLLANSEEARALTGAESDEAAARILRQAGAKNVLIKQGAKGCLLLEGECFTAVEGFAAKAVDGTGAGDALAAGMIAGLLEGKPLVECARLGCACGAAAVEQVGAFGAVRSRAAAEEKLAGRM